MTLLEQKRIDEFYMREALSLALKGTGTTSPNPRVGCVIVRNGEVIGRGAHLIYGQAHAEVNAINNAKGDVEGATVYVNLEPCSHKGKTPSCAKMLIENKVTRVVVGIVDPNPVVYKKGITMLQNADIEVVTGVLKEECLWMNRGFIRSIKLKRPWVTLKIATSLDGNIALKDGSSKWITGPESREKVHILRADNDAILTGKGTILADDPELTVRFVEGINPLIVVLDRKLTTPINAKILAEGKVVFFTTKEASEDKIETFITKGANFEYIDVPQEEQISLILHKLCEYGVNYLLIESGARVTSSFLASGLVDSLSMFISPKFMGNGIHCTEYLSLQKMNQAIKLKKPKYHKVGEDLLVEGVLECSPEL